MLQWLLKGDSLGRHGTVFNACVVGRLCNQHPPTKYKGYVEVDPAPWGILDEQFNYQFNINQLLSSE